MYIIKDYSDEYGTETFYYKKEENAIKKLREIITSFYSQDAELYFDIIEEYGDFETYLTACIKNGECCDVAEYYPIEWEDE